MLRWQSEAAPAPAPAAAARTATSWAAGSGAHGTPAASAASALDDEPAEMVDDEIEIESDIEVIYSEDDAW